MIMLASLGEGRVADFNPNVEVNIRITLHGILGERGSAPQRGRHSTIFVSTKCVCAVAA